MSSEVKQKHYWQHWDEAKEEQWNYLCQREQNGLLTEAEKKELEEFYDELDSLEFAILQPTLTKMTEQIAKLRKASMLMQNENELLLEFSKEKLERLNAVESRVEILRSEYELLKEEYARLAREKMNAQNS
jgi:hypothetical protein